MSITLSLSAADLDNDALHELTRAVCSDLIEETGASATLATQEGVPGTKSGSLWAGRPAPLCCRVAAIEFRQVFQCLQDVRPARSSRQRRLNED